MQSVTLFFEDDGEAEHFAAEVALHMIGHAEADPVNLVHYASTAAKVRLGEPAEKKAA